MQDDLVERTGCFVYLILQPIRPRPRPSETSNRSVADTIGGAKGSSRTRRFSPGQLVAVDAVRQGEKCSYMRLSDGSGWLPSITMTQHTSCKGGSADSDSDESMITPLLTLQEIKVERSIFSFYVDNCPFGQALRPHPNDSLDRSRDEGDGMVVLESMQRIYCDRKVTHPQTKVCFYRVQGTNGWVFNRTRGGKRTMLVEVSKVKTGLFCFQALVDMVVRRGCTTKIESATQVRIQKGQSVAVDIVRESDRDDGDGPFLRLTDGTGGWLYTHMDGVRMMKEVPVTRGIWELRVLNPPVGVSLRRHPLDCKAETYDKIYQTHSFIQADFLVRTDGTKDGDGPTTFYRVKNTNGWVFDRRGETEMLELLTTHDSSTTSSIESSTSESVSGWAPEFVRGIAATIDHIHETDYSPSDQVLTFQTNDDILLVVYCSTQTVGIRPSGQSFTWHRHCGPKELWEHLRKDLVEIMTSGCDPEASTPRHRLESPRKSHLHNAEREFGIRRDLLGLDEEIEAIQQKRVALLEKIRMFDRERAEEAKVVKDQIRAHTQESGQQSHPLHHCTESNKENVAIIYEADTAGDYSTVYTTIQSEKDTVIQNYNSTDSSTDPSSSGDESSLFASVTIFSDELSGHEIELEPSMTNQRRMRLEEAVNGKRLEVRQRIQHLLELKSQETAIYDGAFEDTFTLEEGEDDDDDDDDDGDEGIEVHDGSNGGGDDYDYGVGSDVDSGVDVDGERDETLEDTVGEGYTFDENVTFEFDL